MSSIPVSSIRAAILALLVGFAACGDAALAPPTPGVAFDLTGFWVGTYPCCGSEIVEVAQVGSEATATKVTGDQFIAAGEVTWSGDVETGEAMVVGRGANGAIQSDPATLQVSSGDRYTVTRVSDGLQFSFDRIPSRPEGTIALSSDAAGNGSFDSAIQEVGSPSGTIVSGAAGINEVDNAWSPDGSQLAFTSGTIGGGSTAIDLDLVDVESGSRTTLATGLGQPAWSPDGTRIVATQSTGNGFEANLVVVDVATGAIQTLVADGLQNVNANWSPDGSTIIYTKVTDLHTIGADGTDPRQLTDGCGCGWPAYSPDGSRVVFTQNFDIAVMNADGSGTTTLFSEPSIAVDPTWSPDGEWIAFTKLGGGGIFLLRADGDVVVKFADGTSPSWTR